MELEKSIDEILTELIDLDVIGQVTQEAIRDLASKRVGSNTLKDTTPYSFNERRGAGGIQFTLALNPNGLCTIIDNKIEDRFTHRSHNLIGVWTVEGNALTIQAIFFNAKNYDADSNAEENYEKEVECKTYNFEYNPKGDLVMNDNQFINCDAVKFPCVLEKCPW